jgi:hypothetical protein
VLAYPMQERTNGRLGMLAKVLGFDRVAVQSDDRERNIVVLNVQ